jgi:hypothetical protein
VITRGDLVGGITDISQSLGHGELMMFGAVFSWAPEKYVTIFSL